MLEQEDKKEILNAIQGLSARMDEFGVGQQEMRESQQEMRGTQQEMRGTQQEMRGSIKSLEVGQQEMRGTQQEMRGSIKSLEEGQHETRGSIQSLQEEMRGSIEELHETVHALATHMDERFDQVDQRFERVEGRVGRIEATMVTKDYLDDKLAQQGSHYGELIRQTNGKIHVMADELVKEKSLSSASAKKIASTAPFGRR